MKKALKVLLCYAIGMVASSLGAAEAFSSIDFSNENLWGKMPEWGLGDDGVIGTQAFYYWAYMGDWGNASYVTNYATQAERLERYDGFIAEKNPQPPYMKNGGYNTGYLCFRTVSPLARTFGVADQDGDSVVTPIPEQDGLFVDTLVRFYPREGHVTDVPTADVRGKAKFMCWLSAETNLVVTAGRYDADGNLYRTNYVTTATIKPTRWYRLTARAIANAATQDGKSATCFVLYLDGEPVQVEEGGYAIGDDDAAMQAMFAGNSFFAQRSLFPSIRKFETVVPGLYGVAVSGYGAMDEYGVVKEGNPFAHEADSLEMTVSLEPEKVTNVWCSVIAAGFEEPYFTTNTTDAAEVTFKVRPSDTIYIRAQADSAVSMASELVLSGNTGAVADNTGAVGEYCLTMIDTSPFPDASKVTARLNTGNAYFLVGGNAYASLLEAMDAATEDPSKTLTLASDVTLDADPEAENGQMRVLARHEFVLDLHGHTLTGQHFDEEAAIYDQGRLTVIDSDPRGTGAIVAPGTAIEVVSDNDALVANHRFAALTLGSETVTNLFTVKGRVSCEKGELSIKGGRYLTPHSMTPSTAFYLKDYVVSERFIVEGPEAQVESGASVEYWRVIYNNKLLVRFETTRGTPVPTQTNVVANAKIAEPTLDIFGYSVTNWYDKATGLRWNFAEDAVTNHMTLVGQVAIDTYTIAYDRSGLVPNRYTVETDNTPLPTVQKPNFTFVGWYDTNVCDYVTAVGLGATFVTSGNTVTGNLALVSKWAANVLAWGNTTGRHSESNGTYAGRWSFTIPTAEDLASGATVAIDEIAFGVVNPLLYAKTADYLAVEPKGGSAVVSALRPDYHAELAVGYDAGTNVLKNGRAKIAYRFPGEALKVIVGQTNTVYFSSTAETPTQTGGFLRLTHAPGADDALFGNCATDEASSPIERYGEFCPTYEVTGHAVEVSK